MKCFIKSKILWEPTEKFIKSLFFFKGIFCGFKLSFFMKYCLIIVIQNFHFKYVLYVLRDKQFLKIASLLQNTKLFIRWMLKHGFYLFPCRFMSGHVGSCRFMAVHVGSCRFMSSHVDSCRWIEYFFFQFLFLFFLKKMNIYLV